MNYKYDCGNEEITVWHTGSSDDIFVSVETMVNGYKSYKRSIHEDERGRFFTWNKHKIYLDNYKKISIDSIKKKIDNNDYITDSELCQAIMSTGVDNVRFIIPMSEVDCRVIGLSIIDPTKKNDVVCHIVEDFNRYVKDNYKLRLCPDVVDENTPYYEDYYVTDLVSSLMSGYIKIV